MGAEFVIERNNAHIASICYLWKARILQLILATAIGPTNGIVSIRGGIKPG